MTENSKQKLVFVHVSEFDLLCINQIYIEQLNFIDLVNSLLFQFFPGTFLSTLVYVNWLTQNRAQDPAICN